MDATTRAIIGLVRAHAMHYAELSTEYLRRGDDRFEETTRVAYALLEDVIYQAQLGERPITVQTFPTLAVETLPYGYNHVDMTKYANKLLRTVAGR